MRILLVEDHADTLELMIRMLALKGHEVAGASTAAEARDLCRSGHFDLMFSDIILPDGEGWELANAARQTGISAISLSSLATQGDLSKSREAGFLAHLTKPIDFEVLEKVIASVWAQRATMDRTDRSDLRA